MAVERLDSPAAASQPFISRQRAIGLTGPEINESLQIVLPRMHKAVDIPYFSLEENPIVLNSEGRIIKPVIVAKRFWNLVNEEPHRMRAASYLIDNVAVDPSSHDFLKNLAQMGLSIKDVQIILLTHAHWDHVRGITALFEEGFEGEVYAPLKSAIIMDRGNPNFEKLVALDRYRLRHGRHLRYPDFPVSKWLKDGEVFKTNTGREISVHEAPGHSPDSTVYIAESESVRKYGWLGIMGDVLWGGFSRDLASDLSLWHEGLIKLTRTYREINAVCGHINPQYLPILPEKVARAAYLLAKSPEECLTNPEAIIKNSPWLPEKGN